MKYKNIIQVFLFLYLISITLNLFSQNKPGFPFIKNYTRSQFGGGIQTWMISQSDEGIMYFGNNSGLLKFDGSEWEFIANA